MARKEFSKAVKVACIKRATVNGNQYCEGCGALCLRWQIDHDNPDGLTGKPTLENAKLLCIPCHAEKTKDDTSTIAKAKRREAKHLGVKAPPKFQPQGFQRSPPQNSARIPDKLAHLPRNAWGKP